MSDAFMTNEPLDPPNDTEVRFDEIVGEGKRYADKDIAAKAIVEKDRFIERLKQEAAEMRDAIKQQENERAYRDRLAQASRAEPPQAGDPPQAPATEAPALTPEAVDEILDRRDAEKKAQANLETSINKLKEVYGDDYKRHVSKQAQTLGMTTAELTELAAKNPNAFFRVLGVDGQKTEADAFAPPPRSSVSVPPTSASGQKDYAYYSKLRQEKGEAYYFTPSVQNEMWASLKQMGEEAFHKRK